MDARRWVSSRFPSAYFRIRNMARRVVGTERDVKKLFQSRVAAGDVVFDIGANIGAYSAAFLGLGARVVAVEPQPQLARYLRQRLGPLRCDRWHHLGWKGPVIYPL